MIISENLLKEVMSEFQSKKELDCVIENSLPVLFFGDLKSYAKNDFKLSLQQLIPLIWNLKKERDKDGILPRLDSKILMEVMNL